MSSHDRGLAACKDTSKHERRRRVQRDAAMCKRFHYAPTRRRNARKGYETKRHDRARNPAGFGFRDDDDRARRTRLRSTHNEPVESTRPTSTASPRIFWTDASSQAPGTF